MAPDLYPAIQETEAQDQSRRGLDDDGDDDGLRIAAAYLIAVGGDEGMSRLRRQFCVRVCARERERAYLASSWQHPIMELLDSAAASPPVPLSRLRCMNWVALAAAGPDAVGEQYKLPPCCSHDSPTLRTPSASEHSGCASRPEPFRGPSRPCGPRRRSVGRGLHQNCRG